MGLFDNLKNKITKAAGNRSETVVFEKLPDNVEEFKALPQAALATPFDTAALTVLALCFYPENKDASLEMLQFISGPREISNAEKSFIKDRFMDADYVARSYFAGATNKNDYVPSEPYSITVSENPYSYDNEGYATLYIASGGADNPRSVKLRKGKDGKWYLWEQFLLVGIRKPESDNPWA